MYLPDEGIGLGLISGDGWRVPYSGSDSAVYHEAIGHPIGLPHPEPIDDSVMGVAQYRYWINQTWLNDSQKRALGFLVREEPGAAKAARPTVRDDLFTAFTALQNPVVPRTNEPVTLRLRWPEGVKVRELKAARANRAVRAVAGPPHRFSGSTSVHFGCGTIRPSHASELSP